MRWTERQVAMLGAMGIRLWAPARPAVAPVVPGVEPGPGDRSSSSAPPAPSIVRPASGTSPPPAIGRETRPPTPRPPLPIRPAAPPPASGRMPPTAPSSPSSVDEAGVAAEWAALRAAADRCTACALSEGRTRAVFASGTPPADWLVVGEAPVELEDREGMPFAGRPGQLLDAMLRAVRVSRDDRSGDPARRACLTLPVKCRAPERRVPTADEIETCTTLYLARQIERVRPRVILALGDAAPMLLRSGEPLGRLRGRVHRYRGLPLVATYHPTSLLRRSADKARAWEDLCLALAVLEGRFEEAGSAA